MYDPKRGGARGVRLDMLLSEVGREVWGMTKSTVELVGESASIKRSDPSSALAKLHFLGLNAEAKPQGVFPADDTDPKPEEKEPVKLACDTQPWLVEERKERCVAKRMPCGDNPAILRRQRLGGGQVILNWPRETKIWICEPKSLAGRPEPRPFQGRQQAGHVGEQFGK
jgi:hypothetical protein